MENQYVIMEVRQDEDNTVNYGKELWFPNDVFDNKLDEQECLWLDPSRLISEQELERRLWKIGMLVFQTPERKFSLEAIQTLFDMQKEGE
jgi:hypothetical protein